MIQVDDGIYAQKNSLSQSDLSDSMNLWGYKWCPLDLKQYCIF